MFGPFSSNMHVPQQAIVNIFVEQMDTEVELFDNSMHFQPIVSKLTLCSKSVHIELLK